MKLRRLALGLVALAAIAIPAFAGGPNIVYDYANRIPYVWKMDSWPNGAVPVYTDLGALGRLSNSRADELVAAGFQQWVDVPTASYNAAVVGDVSLLGLPDITCPSASDCNALQVLGVFNGGGVHVIYDTNGTILRNVFGIFSALGVTGYDAVTENDNEILESWVILNGNTIQSTDPNGDRWFGVMTHEFGHSANLAHTQGNGASLTLGNTIGAGGCAPLASGVAADQIETMYPFVSVNVGGTGAGMGTVDKLDDIAPFSDLYPMPGWPQNHGTIQGTVYAMRRAKIVETGEEIELTGVNVVARNIADPLNDYVSSYTGIVSKGQAGFDGSFTFNGLTPGADYALYIDGHVSGAMSVPIPLNLPGPEEFYNGPDESGNGASDDRCQWSTIAATPGSPATANIFINRVPGAPELLPMPTLAIPTGITDNGLKVVGSQGSTAFTWTPVGGLVNIGGSATGGQASMSGDGSVIAFSARDENNKIRPALWAGGTNWTLLPTFTGATSACGESWGSTYAISGDGTTIVGLGYFSCAKFRAFKWTAAEGMIDLPLSDSSPRGNRANAVNYDGSVIGGWHDAATGLRRGVRWVNGVPSLMSEDPGYFVGETLGMNSAGTYLVGYQAGPDRKGWRWSEAGGVEELGFVSGQRVSAMIDVSEDGNVVTGYTDFPSTRFASLWTPELGWTDFQFFLNAQGTFANDWQLATTGAMDPTGKYITGWAFARAGQTGFWVRMLKTVVCHASIADPDQKQTLEVDFPENLGVHLLHGDTVGYCPDGN